MIFRNGLGVRNVGTTSAPVFEDIDDDTQVRFDAGLNLLGGKLQLNLATLYTRDTRRSARATCRTSTGAWPTRRSAARSWSSALRAISPGTFDRRDISFRVDLTGSIGKLFDVSGF